MEFGMEKCAILVMKSSKWYRTDGIELPNRDKIRTLGENDNFKYLGILEADTIKQVQMKDKIQKEYLRRTRKLLKTKLSTNKWYMHYPSPVLENDTHKLLWDLTYTRIT